MNRNRFGINLDEGIPLSTQEEFDLLYVPIFQSIYDSLIEWIANSEESVLLGGQIGSGKSSLINLLVLNNKFKPDIELNFDKDGLNLDQGDFWAIVLEGFIRIALDSDVDLSFSLLPEELCGLERNNWGGLLEKLSPTGFSISKFNNRASLRLKIGDMFKYIEKTLQYMGELIEKKLNRKPIVLASGIDKFEKSSATYFSIRDVLSFLSGFKTLFEVNIIHLFKFESNPLKDVNGLHLTAFCEDDIKKLIIMRLGKYNDSYKNQLEVLSKYSGGNPRQAVRLLNHFLAAMKKQSRTISESIVFAIRETCSDFFSYSQKPSPQIIKVIHRDKFIESSLLISGNEERSATMAVYGNWILINGKGEGTRWPAIINPLIKAAFEESVGVEEPEMKILKEYGNSNKISIEGLSFNMIDDQTGLTKTSDRLLVEYLMSGIEKPLSTSLDETLEIISSALLSKNRTDRVIIAYNNRDILQVALSYFIAKANTYEYQTYKHFVISTEDERDILLQFEEVLDGKKDFDIYSIEFCGSFEKEQLERLDKYRDRLLDKEVIWWIQNDKLKEYMPYWTQLRQLFEVFVLEDKLFDNLKIKDIEADMELYSNLIDDTDKKETSEYNVLKNLKVVLSYLKGDKNE